MTSTTEGPLTPAGTRRRRWIVAWRAGRKVVVSTLGGAIGLVGLLLLPLPGPGMLVVGLGLGILSTEYRWPGRLSRWLRHEASVWAGRARDRRAARRAARRPIGRR